MASSPVTEPLPRTTRWTLTAILCVALAGLVAHVIRLRFLCDDAFISFRYARNLALGHGLVFNPGFERVEGYSNFLWVLVLALGRCCGVAPERLALPLSWAATFALWAATVAFAARRARGARLVWAVAVPALLLALNRSFAVWASSGLETRVFELFELLGVFALIGELESAEGAGFRVGAAWWFALGALTRPDGVLIGGAALATGAFLSIRSGTSIGRALRATLPFLALVAAHFAFRRLYYGAWLPNTYYAKVGGRTWWDAGFEYLGAFALEYALWLWLPLAAFGALAYARAGRGRVPLVFAAAVLPHALYVASIGGDHFEYRPLDLYLPPLFVLVGAGLAALAVPDERVPGRVRAWATALALAIAALLTFELPWQTHVQFPARYLPGFPGGLTSEPERVPFLEPSRNLLYRLPGLDRLAATHRSLLRTLSRHFIGLRAEEHAHFLATVMPEGLALDRMVRQGLLPRDTYIATGSVGAIPYASDLRTLDRLGLTDAVVAHSAPQAVRVMAHDRSASFEDAGHRGVDLWAAHDVRFLWRVGAPHAIDLVTQRREFYAAEVFPDTFLLVMLPQGIEHTAARFPKLHFVPGNSDAFLERWFREGTAALADSLRRKDDDAVRRDLAYLLMMEGRPAEALTEYTRVLARTPEDPAMLLDASGCEAELGHRDAARAGLERALALARMRGDVALANRIERALMSLAG